MFARSNDGSQIHYEVTDDRETALVFVHGWVGNARWWDAQRDAFSSTHGIVTIDLAGHGRSSRERTEHTGEAYVNDIVAVVNAVAAPRVILVGHSMSGAYVVGAAPHVEGLARVILVDTMKDLDAIPSHEQVAPMIASYRADYANALETVLPPRLFSALTPPDVRERLLREFRAVSGETAASLLEPLYRYDVRTAAKQVRVPVRGIGSLAASCDVNRRYFADYDYAAMDAYGHYPMLEAPEAFNAALRSQL